MFHIHGWLVLSSDPYESDDAAVRSVVEWIANRLDDTCNDLPDYQISLEARNGTWVLVVHAVTNRKLGVEGDLDDLLVEIGRRAPGSYGVFHSRDADTDNEFRVTVVVRGQVSHCTDDWFSPSVPTIEDP